MKITYIANTAIPSRAANNIQIMKMCEALSQNRNELILLLPNLKKREIKIDIDIYNYFGVKKCFKIKKINIPRIKGYNSMFTIITGIKSKLNKTNLVYTRYIKCAFLCSYLKIPTIYETHDIPKKKIDKFIFRILIKLKNTKKIVIISQALYNYYKNKYNLNSKKIIISPSGASPIKNNIIPVNIKKNNCYLQIAYIGSMYKGKGMEVISKLISKCSFASFHLIGGSPDDIEKWKKIMNFSNVIFYGHIAPEKISQYIVNFDILLAPYQKKVAVHGGKGDTANWMSPLKIFEYMAAGKAIIASDLPILREVLTNNKNCLLCHPEKIDKWLKAINKLKDENFRIFLGQNAKTEFLNKYTYKKRVDLILNSIKNE